MATSAAVAGAAYFGVIFALGFLLGVVRLLVVAPRVGAFGAVALELPLMLLASWVACGWAVRRWRVPVDFGSRALMGGLAFGLLLGAETLLGVYGFGRSVAAQMEDVREPAGLLGLAGQLVFGLLPLIRSREPVPPPRQ